MDILFLGGVFAKEEQGTILAKSKGSMQSAANILQWSIIGGIEEALGKPISLLNSVFVGSYPRLYRDLLLKSREWRHREDAEDKEVGFLNIYGVKQVWRAIALAREARRWAQDGTGGKKLVIYSMHTPFLYAAVKAKEVNPDIAICLIVPDLPEFMTLGARNSWLYRALKTIDVSLMARYLCAVDCFVLLTDHMTERLSITTKPYIVVEGIANEGDMGKPLCVAEGRLLVYTGTLNRAYGIVNLLKAFGMTRNVDYRLRICGAGEAEADVRSAVEQDGRIEYLGQIPRDEAVGLQRRATALINPRNGEGEFTKYSFPSKNMEYLLSGRPLIAYKYDDYSYYIRGNTSADMARVIDCVLSKDERELSAFGSKARDFILEYKNQRVQGKRIVDMLRSVEDVC